MASQCGQVHQHTAYFWLISIELGRPPKHPLSKAPKHRIILYGSEVQTASPSSAQETHHSVPNICTETLPMKLEKQHKIRGPRIRPRNSGLQTLSPRANPLRGNLSPNEENATRTHSVEAVESAESQKDKSLEPQGAEHQSDTSTIATQASSIDVKATPALDPLQLTNHWSRKPLLSDCGGHLSTVYSRTITAQINMICDGCGTWSKSLGLELEAILSRSSSCSRTQLQTL